MKSAPGIDGLNMEAMNGQHFDDASIAVDVRIVGEVEDRRVKVAGRMEVGTDSGYWLYVWPVDGMFGLARLDHGQAVALIAPRPFADIRVANASNRLELRCTGTTIAARIHGKPAGKVEDRTYRRGKLAVGAGAELGTRHAVDARFDKLLVISL